MLSRHAFPDCCQISIISNFSKNGEQKYHAEVGDDYAPGAAFQAYLRERTETFADRYDSTICLVALNRVQTRKYQEDLTAVGYDCLHDDTKNGGISLWGYTCCRAPGAPSSPRW